MWPRFTSFRNTSEGIFPVLNGSRLDISTCTNCTQPARRAIYCIHHHVASERLDQLPLVLRLYYHGNYPMFGTQSYNTSMRIVRPFVSRHD
jgi:hypothetical protein